MAIWCNKEKSCDKVGDIITRPTEFTKGSQGRPSHYKNLLFLGMLFTLLLIVSITSIMVMRIKCEPPNVNMYQEKPFQEPPGSPTTSIAEKTTFSNPKENLTLPGKPKIVSRKEWLAQPPVEKASTLALPVHYVIISHTATENCTDQASCTFHVRFIQTFHIENRNWWDIGYNFLVGGDGYAYEGRGWKSEGAHTYGYNSKSIGITFIGTFNKDLPPERQLLAAKQLIQKGVQSGYIAQDYKLLAARQLQTTQSPGLRLYEDIKTWPHWAETP